MPNLKDAPPAEVAKRMRDLAAGLSDPADIEAAEAYARELERTAAYLGPKRRGEDPAGAQPNR